MAELKAHRRPRSACQVMDFHHSIPGGKTLYRQIGRHQPEHLGRVEGGPSAHAGGRAQDGKLIEFGAWDAIDLDGGGSSTLWVKDKVVNSPIEDGVPGQERLVGDHLVMWVGGVVVPPSKDYEVVKPVKPRKTPSMFETATKPNLSVGTLFQSEVMQGVTETIPAVNGKECTIVWVQMPDGYWVPKFYKSEYVRNLLG